MDAKWVRPVWPPTPGYYLVRLVRGGPLVGAEIAYADGLWSCNLNGEVTGPCPDPLELPNLDKIHFYGRRTIPSEVRYRIATAQWAALHATDHPAANPRRPVNVQTIIPF